MAISKAVEEGCKAVICASTGNTSASAAAYGAVAGLETIIVLPKGKIALGKMIQGIAAGAKCLPSMATSTTHSGSCARWPSRRIIRSRS